MSEKVVPLLIALQLTEEQQRLIREQTGCRLSTIPYESAAASMVCRFGGITVRVTRGVFAPAPVTEQLFDLALATISTRADPIVLDIGTGSGAMALALANAVPAASILATDISAAALRCARRNRDRLRLRNVRFMRGSLLSPVPRRLHGSVAVVVANVPYLPPRLAGEVGSFFPGGSAIGEGEDGLGLVRELAAQARAFLVPGGSLLLQIAGVQWTAFTSELMQLGYAAPQLRGAGEHAPVAGRVVWRGPAG